MSALIDQVVAEDHILGSDEVKYTLVEYGDLQCPDTASAEPEITEIAERFQDQFRLVYRHFPLTDIHANAYRAALATEAAARQNKFWEMRTQLLDHQDQLEPSDLLKHAEQLGLDAEQFKRDMADRQLAAKIDADIQSGTRSGVDSTPTFFLNGKMLDPGLDLFEIFESMGSKGAADDDDDREDDNDDDEEDGDEDKDEDDEEQF